MPPPPPHPGAGAALSQLRELFTPVPAAPSGKCGARVLLFVESRQGDLEALSRKTRWPVNSAVP